MWLKDTLCDTGKIKTLMILEDRYPNFFTRWEKVRDRILNDSRFKRKDDSAMVIYCALFAKYISDLRCKEEKKYLQLEEYIFLLILIQTYLKEKYLIFENLEAIYKVDENEINAVEENKLLQIVTNFNEKISSNWGKSEYRVENLKKTENKINLQIFCDKVTNEESKITTEISEFARQNSKFILENAYKVFACLYFGYDEVLIETKKKHKELNKIERKDINSQQNACEFAKTVHLEELKFFDEYEKHQLVYVIFENGTVVGLLENDQDIERFKVVAKKRLIESKNEGSVASQDYTNDIDDRRMSFLYQSQEMGCMNGIWNYFWEDEDDYFYNDEEIAREYRNKDIKDLKIRYILYNGEVVYDSKKDEKECK